MYTLYRICILKFFIHCHGAQCFFFFFFGHKREDEVEKKVRTVRGFLGLPDWPTIVPDTVCGVATGKYLRDWRLA